MIHGGSGWFSRREPALDPEIKAQRIRERLAVEELHSEQALYRLELKNQKTIGQILDHVYRGSPAPEINSGEIHCIATRISNMTAVRVRSPDYDGGLRYNEKKVRNDAKYGQWGTITLQTLKVDTHVEESAYVALMSVRGVTKIVGYYRDQPDFRTEAAANGWLLVNRLEDVDTLDNLTLMNVWSAGARRSRHRIWGCSG